MQVLFRLGCLMLALVPLARLQANSLVQLRTVLGDVEVELLDQEKPATVANFKRYVAAGLYENCFFHRAVPNFVLQGGGFTITNRESLGVAPVPTAIRTFPPVTNEFRTGPFRSNVAGTVAMAKTANPDSATSQFFINLKDNSGSLDNPANSGGFTVFGVVRGDTNILARLNSFVGRNPPTGTNLIINAGRGFTELPILTLRTNVQGQLTADALVFVDISALSVRIDRPLEGGREISWDSVRGGTNLVEFTTEFPPVWQTLSTLVRPETLRSVVVDPLGTDARFYRVRVAY